MSRRQKPEEFDHSAFRARLAIVVRAAGTQEKAAQLAGMTARNLRSLLRGESRDTSAHSLRRLAVATGVDLHWLFIGKGEWKRGEVTENRVFLEREACAKVIEALARELVLAASLRASLNQSDVRATAALLRHGAKRIRARGAK